MDIAACMQDISVMFATHQKAINDCCKDLNLHDLAHIAHYRMEGRGVITDSSGRQWVGEFDGHVAKQLRLKLK